MAGLSLCLLVASGLVAWAVTRDDTYVAPTPPAAARPAVDATGAALALRDLEAAVRSGDRAAARALAPADDPAAADDLEALVDNAERIGVTDFTLRYVDDEGTPTTEGAWDAAVDATWRFRGFDRSVAAAEVRAHLVDTGDGVGLTGFGGADGVSPLWLSGPVEVRRSPTALVVVAGTPAEADEYAARARAAVPVVRRVLPGWRSGLVVEVPSSAADLERALGAEPGSYRQIAAVTSSADGSQAPGAPVHVFANPEVFGALRPTGAQVVMSHEATHVAGGAWDSPAPLWLLEGFADYVALRDVRLPVERSAAQVIADVRRDGPPRQLPDAAAFGSDTPHLGATYEGAWLAAREIAERAGERALVAFYRAVDGGQQVAPALEETTGLTVAGLTASWRALLEDLAADSAGAA